MRNTLRLFLLLIALVLVGNFVILKIYGDVLQSTHLFIVRGTVFYPVAGLNLILGILMVIFLVWEWLNHRKVLDFTKGTTSMIIVTVITILTITLLTYLLLRSLGW